MAKDLLEFLSAEKPKDGPPEDTGPDLGSRRESYLAEAVGVEDPGALTKLIEVVVKRCMAGGASYSKEED